jgi:hypothetical protein
MKKCFSGYLLSGALLMALSFVSGCNEGSSDSSSPGQSAPVSTGSSASQNVTEMAGNSAGLVNGNTFKTPEPGTLAMLLTSMSGVGAYLVIRRKRRAQGLGRNK